MRGLLFILGLILVLGCVQNTPMPNADADTEGVQSASGALPTTDSGEGEMEANPSPMAPQEAQVDI